MVVGFVNAGIMSLTQAVGVIMGANIGTTVTSVLIALNFSDIAPVAVLIGMILQIYIVPVLFVIFQSLQEKLTPMHWDDVENSGEAVSDIEQYSK